MFSNEISTITWITGAHGFIGKHLARELAGAGHLVCGLGHGIWPEAEAMSWGVTHWLNGDLSASNLNTLRRLGGEPDVIMHLAGGSSVGAAIAQPKEDFTRTVTSTIELFDWLRQEVPAARVVAVSSAAVYGAGHTGPISEDARLSPYSPYGHHKLMMESMCRSYGATFGLRSAVARLFSVYGAGLRKQLLWDLCCKLELGATDIQLGGNGDELRDWTDVRDVVRAIALLPPLADSDVPTFNLASGIATNVQSVASQIIAQWTATSKSVPLHFNGQARAGDPHSLQADATRLTNLGFDWRVPLNQGLADYVDWYRTRSHA